MVKLTPDGDGLDTARKPLQPLVQSVATRCEGQGIVVVDDIGPEVLIQWGVSFQKPSQQAGWIVKWIKGYLTFTIALSKFIVLGTIVIDSSVDSFTGPEESPAVLTTVRYKAEMGDKNVTEPGDISRWQKI